MRSHVQLEKSQMKYLPLSEGADKGMYFRATLITFI